MFYTVRSQNKQNKQNTRPIAQIHARFTIGRRSVRQLGREFELPESEIEEALREAVEIEARRRERKAATISRLRRFPVGGPA